MGKNHIIKVHKKVLEMSVLGLFCIKKLREKCIFIRFIQRFYEKKLDFLRKFV